MANADRVQPGPLKTEPIITIIHQNPWIAERHGIAFLGPLVTGILKLNAKTSRTQKR